MSDLGDGGFRGSSNGGHTSGRAAWLGRSSTCMGRCSGGSGTARTLTALGVAELVVGLEASIGSDAAKFTWCESSLRGLTLCYVGVVRARRRRVQHARAIRMWAWTATQLPVRGRRAACAKRRRRWNRCAWQVLGSSDDSEARGVGVRVTMRVERGTGRRQVCRHAHDRGVMTSAGCSKLLCSLLGLEPPEHGVEYEVHVRDQACIHGLILVFLHLLEYAFV
mmetsp:Transcript_77231/g.153295  ORF Transcript_77231/g.153295 Transcript_77231/m.153295 type:complete len:222 (+) Transcript_77231:195-860(+)